MKSTVAALIVYEDADILRQLEKALSGQVAKIWYACTCREVAELMAGAGLPELIFTETRLCDGTWRDLLKLAQTAFPAPNVILVARLEDIRLYLDAMEEGVADYVVPPFEASGVAHVIQCALHNVVSQRKAARRLAATGHVCGG
jgi:DNA-binding NtrC family response regulator